LSREGSLLMKMQRRLFWICRMEEKFFDDLKEKVQVYFEGVNPCHDFDHTERVMNLALHIGEKEDVDLEILRLSVLLHDIARKEQDESNGKVCHAERGAEIAREVLEKAGYDENKINKIVHCIETHRFRKDNKPETKEAMILFDADKLDGIGGVGIGRAFSFAGHIGALIHDPDIDVENTEAYSKEDTAYREFLVKLVKVKDKMLTEEGKKIAEERHKFMIDFFDRLNKEVRGEL